MEKVDFKKKMKDLYNPSSKEFQIIKVPKMNFLMIDGSGDPNTSEEYKDAVGNLYTLSYAIKFITKNKNSIDYVVMPLEGLWWADDMSRFGVEDKSNWKWTAMIMQPDFVDRTIFEEAIERVSTKKELKNISRIRLEKFEEGMSVQILFIGPYSEEGETIRSMHSFIEDIGFKLRGKHHEIYLSDPGKTEPEKLKTILRQPLG